MVGDRSWMVWTATGIVGIWLAVTVISIFAPDLVTGSEQQHVPIAAATSWLWGLVGTIALLWGMTRLRGDVARRPIWIGVAGATLAVWLVATIIGLAVPVIETGSDPTRIPIGAVVGPLAAALLTALTVVCAGVFASSPSHSALVRGGSP